MVPLLRTQKNEIFAALQGAGLDDTVISKFHLNQSEEMSDWGAYAPRSDSSRSGHLLSFRDSDVIYYFAMQGEGNIWWFRAFPMGTANEVQSKRNDFIGWSELLKQIKLWGGKILTEITADDYWEQLVNVKARFKFDDEDSVDNSPISSKEARVIRQKLSDLEEEIIKHYATSKEEGDLVREKFEYLSVSIERQGKTDWIHTLIGVLASIAVTVGVSAANSDDFWGLVQRMLGSTVGFLTGS